MFSITTAFVILWISGARCASEKSPEKILLDALKANYSPSVRPVRNSERAIAVNLTFKPFNLDEIDEKLQTITVKGTLRMKWLDEFLTWNRSDHLGMDRIIIDQDLVWHPDIVVLNGVGSINHPIQTEKNKVILQHDGAIWWDAEGTFKVTCPMEMVFFPFDTQTCHIKVGNNKYTAREVYPTLWEDDTDLKHLNDNVQWEVTDYAVSNEQPPGQKRMDIILCLKRRSTFYLMNMLFPSLGLTALGNCLYLIPPGTSDRVAVGTTLVLAYTVFMLHVTENMPGSYKSIPYITMLLLVAMMLSTTGVVVSVFILRLSRFATPQHETGLHTNPLSVKELEARQTARSRLLKRIDWVFFAIHLVVFIGMCLSLIILSGVLN